MSTYQDPSNATTAQSCESCETGGGLPSEVLISAGRRRITYRCPQCGRRWSVTDEYPDPTTSSRSREGG